MTHWDPWPGLLTLLVGYAFEWGVFWFYVVRPGPHMRSFDPPPNALSYFVGANILSAAGGCIASACVPTISTPGIRPDDDLLLIALWFGVTMLLEFLFWVRVLLGSRLILFRALFMSHFVNFAIVYAGDLGMLNSR